MALVYHILNHVEVKKLTLKSSFQAAAELKKKRTFRKFTYRGVDLDQLLDMNNEQLMELLPCRIRRKFGRGLKRKPMALIKKLRKKKKECPPNEKPDVVKTHLRDMVIVPEMTGSMVGVYNGKTFNQVEIKVRPKKKPLWSLDFFSTWIAVKFEVLKSFSFMKKSNSS